MNLTCPQENVPRLRLQAMKATNNEGIMKMRGRATLGGSGGEKPPGPPEVGGKWKQTIHIIDVVTTMCH